MGKAELEKLLGVSSTPRREKRENNNHKIVVFRKKLPTGDYLFSCRGYKKISADEDLFIYKGRNLFKSVGNCIGMCRLKGWENYSFRKINKTTTEGDEK